MIHIITGDKLEAIATSDSGHEWFTREDFHKAIKDLKASRAKVKELEAKLVLSDNLYETQGLLYADIKKKLAETVKANELLLGANTALDKKLEEFKDTPVWKCFENSKTNEEKLEVAVEALEKIKSEVTFDKRDTDRHLLCDEVLTKISEG